MINRTLINEVASDGAEEGTRSAENKKISVACVLWVFGFEFRSYP